MRLQADFSVRDKSLPAGFGAFQNASDGGYERGLREGKQSEHDLLWDAFQDNGNRTDYNSAFANSSWTDEAFKPKYDIKPTYAPYMFQNSSITNLKQRLLDIGVALDFSNTPSLAYAFQNSKVTHVPFMNLEKTTALTYTFRNCKDLKEVSMFVTEQAAFSYTFANCESLTDLTMTGIIGTNFSVSNSPLLTTASVQSIVDCLKDLTGQTAQTLTFHKDVGNRLTDTQKAAVTAKNWTLVY